MNRPLWQRARKDFIRLVDDDKIPEEHKRLNLHYLRTLPYKAISTAKPIIVESTEPQDVMLFPLGHTIKWTTLERYYVKHNGKTYVQYRDETHSKTLTKPFYRSDGKELFGDLSDDELKAKFTKWVESNNW